MEYKVIGWTDNDNENYPATDLDSKEIYDAIIADIRANNYAFTGQDHHYKDTCTPVLNNGKRVCCGQRTWGGIMADAHGVDDWDGRAYVYFFLTCCMETKYPPNYVDDSAIIKDFVEPPREVNTWDDPVKEERIAFETRKYTLSSFSWNKMLLKAGEYCDFVKLYNNNPAIIASLIMENVKESNSFEETLNACAIVSNIISCWLSEDKAKVRDKRLAHLEKKFEFGRVEKALCELCPDEYSSELDRFGNDLLPIMFFLLDKVLVLDAAEKRNDIWGRISKYLESLFEYSYLYKIDTVASSVPEKAIEAAIKYLDESDRANKLYLTNDEIVALSVGSVYHEVDKDGILHLYRCRKEQMEAYKKLSATLGEWSGRTNGVRLDFVTDSELISFKVVVGKKYELFINGIKEEHIELLPGKMFYKKLNTQNGENRITLIYPSHEAGAISELALSAGASYRRYEHKYGKKILFIGDSITQGWDTVSDSNSYAYQVSLRYDADTVIFGVGGAYFHESILPSEDTYHPDIVIVAFGANDFGKGIDALKKNMPEFLDKLLLVYSNSQIIGLTPICGRSGMSDKGSPFREFICATYEKYGIAYIDGSNMVSPLDENYADRYHPNDKGYIEMADKLIPKLNELIK